MESDSVFQDPQLPFPSGQIQALYQKLFQAPARLDELLVAVQQVRGANCPRELELPLVLLEMERRRQEQEQVLWDLELLAGAGLSLFWPGRGQFRRPWDGARSSENHNQELCIWAGGEEELHFLPSIPCRWCLAQKGDIWNRSQQLLEKWQAKGLAVMLGKARAEGGAEPDQRFGNPEMPAWATLGFILEPDLTAESISRNKAEKKKIKDPSQEVGRNLPEFRAQGPYQPPSWILYSPETLKPGELLLLPESLQKGAKPEQERTETQALVGTETSRDHKGKSPQSWREETPKVQREDSSKFQKKERPQIQTQHIQREKTPKAQRQEISQSQTEETPKLQTGEILWAQRNETPRAQGEISQPQTEEIPKLQGREILWAQRNEALRAQGEAIPWAQKEEITWALREEIPKVQRGETPWIQEKIPKVQRGEISQTQREKIPKTHKGKIPQVLREETAKAQQGDTRQVQDHERKKQVHRQIFQFQGNQSLHSLERENLQCHEEEVLQFQTGDIVKFWGKENPQPQGEVLFPFQRKETKQSPKGDSPLFHPGVYPQFQGKTILQSQRNKIPQDQGKVIAEPWGREIPWSLGKVTPKLQGQVRLGARPGGQWVPSQKTELLKTPAQWRLREHEAVKLGTLRVQSQQALGAAVKQRPGLAVSRLKDMEDGQFQPQALLANPGPVELKQGHPNPPSRELVFLGLTLNQQEDTLKRLLELQGEARRRHQRDREQQRLRVQERLRITRSRRSGGDLLGSLLTTSQPWMKGDVARQRCALREQLVQRHKERTGLLQAQRERNTRSFQELLRPQRIGENTLLLPALFQTPWDLRRVSSQRDGGEKGTGKLPDGQKSEVSTGQNYRKARDLTNHKGPGDPDTHTHHRGSQLCPT